MSEKPTHNPEVHGGFWMRMEKEKIASYEQDDKQKIMAIFDSLVTKEMRRKIHDLSDAYGERSLEGNEKLATFNVDPTKIDDNTQKFLDKDIEAKREELQDRAIETFRLEKAAMYDDLTGLLRRGAFQEMYEEERRRLSKLTEADDDNSVLLFVDIDDFKRVNDEHTHKGGDKLLEDIGTKLNETLRPLDAACRHGGDEITIMLKHIKKADIIKAIARVFHELTSIPIANSEEKLSVSVGARVLNSGVQELSYYNDIVGQADTGAYNTKSEGKNGVTIIETITPNGDKDPRITGSLYTLADDKTLVLRNENTQGIELQKEDPTSPEAIQKTYQSTLDRLSAPLRAQHGGKLPDSVQKKQDALIAEVQNAMNT